MGGTFKRSLWVVLTKQTQISIFHTENKDRINMKVEKTKRTHFVRATGGSPLPLVLTKRTQIPERRSLDAERCFTKRTQSQRGRPVPTEGGRVPTNGGKASPLRANFHPPLADSSLLPFSFYLFTLLTKQTQI
jgi:hypothetical protein